MTNTKGVCPHCGKNYTFDLARKAFFIVRARMWKLGLLVQDAFPDSTTIEREQLLTGLCSEECYEDYLGPEFDPKNEGDL